MLRGLAWAAGVLAMLGGSAATADRWQASWGAAQMATAGDTAWPEARARDVTLRQIVRVSTGGKQVRVLLSNAHGTGPLTIDAAAVALAPAPGTPRAGTARPLRFAGKATVTLAAGQERWSDVVAMALPPAADVAVSLYLARVPAPQTGHPGARATSFLTSGNHVTDADLPGAEAVTRWYWLAGIDVSAARPATIVAVGDSITDGYGVKPERNTRWTDVLAARLRGNASTRTIGLVNAGIGGNRVLNDGIGPRLVDRFDRDVLGRSGARWAILLEGVNDLGTLTRDAPATPAAHAELVRRITGAFADMAAKAHARGIGLIGGTIMPFGGNDYYHPGPELEADRQAINRFIRESGTFDAVIDFDAVMRDPVHPDRLAPQYDSGDHLHPSEAGYRAMGEAVPLGLFAPAAATPMALTFDDLPAHGPLPPGVTRLSVVRQIAATLAAEKAPAFGFLNGGFGTDTPADSAAATAAWTRAGLALGSHGYAHTALDTLGAAGFAADLARNEAVLRRVAPGDWHWFRYPFLNEGSDPGVRDAARGVLAERGYRIAAVTTSFADYDWNAPYAACMAKGDAAAVARLEAGYLADARAAAVAARAAGGETPQVLLMHAGAFTARMLPRLLAMYRTMGFRFAPLAEVERDPFYAAAVDPSRPGPTA
ncbi:GDSL-type esterase/lipase family protein, partial [uncultured Sphingomonas sp.]|uniref:GDSL-type esterase/lipase family protein n=1 Tax=uncultured Sphingomonas sp. TaxID=158754 RepID=UPI00261CCB50